MASVRSGWAACIALLSRFGLYYLERSHVAAVVNDVKRRVQHPEVHEREDRGSSYWYFRYWEDKPQPDGTIKSSRKFYKCGPSRGKDKISKTRAEIILDDFLAKLVTNQEPAPVESAPPPSQAAPAPAPPEPAISTSTPRGSSTVFPA